MRLRQAILFLPLLSLLILEGGTEAYSKGRESSAQEPDPCEDRSDSAQNVLEALNQRERSLGRREATLAAREADLRMLEEQLAARMSELSTIRNEVKSLVERLDTNRDTRIEDMVRMFNAMRPSEAAPILSKTETALAVDVLSRMNKSKAGKILGAMDATVAARLSEAIASSPKLGPTKAPAP